MRSGMPLKAGRGNVETITNINGYTIDLERGKPTNSELLLIADKLRMESKVG